MKVLLPTTGMRKTEGVPVPGDSGGPFFLEVGQERQLQLAGITSCTITRSPDLTPEQRKILSDAPPTPLYPIWTPLKPHSDLIMSVMASTSRD